MSRPLRLELAGGLYRVTSRGDRREEIFLDDEDRTRWLTILAQVHGKMGSGLALTYNYAKTHPSYLDP